MHYYKRNIGDYAKKAGRLSLLEHGAYTLLIDACYDRERFPTMTEAIEWAWARSPDEVLAVEFVLGRFFTLIDGKYVQDRIREEIEAYQQNAEKNRQIATDREEKRRKNKRTVHEPSPSVHEPSPSVHEPPPNQEPLTINQEPYSVPKGTGGKPPLTPDEIIFGYGVPLLTNAGAADKQARSFLGGLRKAHGDQALIDALRECIRVGPLQPLEWIAKALPPKGARKQNKQEELEARNAAVGEAWLRKMEQQDAQQSAG